MIVSAWDYYIIIFVSSVSTSPSTSNLSCPIWYSWTTLCQDLSLSSCLLFQGFLMLWICDVISLWPVSTSSLFYSPLLMPKLHRRLTLLVLEVALMVASILVGSCKLFLFFSVPLILYYLSCNLTLISPICISYAPLSIGYSSFVLIVPVYFWCNL